MQEDTIVVRSAGKTAPAEYLDLVISDCTCFGMATTKDNKLAIERMQFTKEEPFTLQEFMAYDDAYRDSTAVYWFGSGDPRPDDCVQPYDALVGADDKTILTLFIEGDCSSFHKTDSTLTNDYYAAVEHIIPTVKKSFKLADQKLDGLLNELNDAITKRSLLSALTEAGAITLVSTDWEPESYTKGTVGSTFQWGWVSRTYDYVETPPAKPVESTLTGRRKVLSSTVAAAPSEPIKPLKEQVTEGPVMLTDIEAAEKENEERGRIESEHEMIGPDETYVGKRRKSWFLHNCEYAPTDWHLPGSKAPAKKKAFTELSKPKGEIIVTNERVPTPATGPKQPAKAVPAMTDDRVAKLKVHLETLDRNSQLMTVDPKQMQAAEAKHGDFFSKMGKAPDYADNKLYEWYVAVGDHSVEDLALLAWTAIRAKVVVENDLDLATQPVGAGPKAQPATEPVKLAATVEIERPVRRAVRR